MFQSIRAKIIIIFAVSLISVTLLTLFHWWSISTVEKKLYLSERFSDVLNHILEVRRFEKNFLLYRDPQSLREGMTYLKQINQLVGELQRDIARVAGREASEKFSRNLKDYTRLIKGYEAGFPPTEVDVEQVRSRGKALVDFATELLRLKRQRIHHAFARASGLPFVFWGIFFVVLAIILHVVSARLIKPLGLIRQTTARVAQGDFSPISFKSHGNDEISQLFQAFNKMARELDRNQEALLQSRKIAAIGTFTAGIAHELNNPINNIYLTAEALLDDYSEQLSPEGKELVLDILNQADRSSEIVKNLLDFSRTERPTFAILNLADVINSTIKLVKNQIMVAGIKLKINLPDGLSTIRGNLRNLQQVFLNLFLNAIQAMPGGGEIAISLQDEDPDFVKIEVHDTGKGIKPEDLEHIFEPFYTTKRVGRGTGLGLAVTYALVKKHGGHLEVQSEVGVGTTFSVYLPKDKETGEQASNEETDSRYRE